MASWYDSFVPDTIGGYDFSLDGAGNLLDDGIDAVGGFFGYADKIEQTLGKDVFNINRDFVNGGFATPSATGTTTNPTQPTQGNNSLFGVQTGFDNNTLLLGGLAAVVIGGALLFRIAK